jgi:hypothetical protein
VQDSGASKGAAGAWPGRRWGGGCMALARARRDGAGLAVATSAKDLSKAAAVGAERAMKMRMG